MSSYTIPSTPRSWAETVADTHATADPYNLDISGIGPDDFDSASKLKYEDWLLLRAPWEDTVDEATHETIFGAKKGAELKATAERRLAREPWWRALKANSDNPMEWSHMAAWRLNLAEIMNRVGCPRDLDDGKVYDDTNPFRSLVEPSNHGNRPRRNIKYFGRDGSPESDGASISSSHHSNSVSPSRSDELAASSGEPGSLRGRGGASWLGSGISAHHGNSVSPSRSDGLAASSGEAGSLRGRGGASSLGSGVSAEERMINKHRPDEALINMSLLLLLQGVCMTLLQQPSHESYKWSIVHKQFSFSQPEPGDHTSRSKIMTARTDGCLQAQRPNRDPDNGDALAIIEVKPYRRFATTTNEIALKIQEGAEMAAWISTEATKGLLPANTGTYRRLLVSQDYDQVFITIAEYDDLYVQYIRGDSITWPKITPEGSPSKKGPRDDPPAGTSSDEEPRGRPTEDTEETKPVVSSAFRSSSKAPSGASAPSMRLPSRSRAPPVTPSKQTTTRPEETPQAPKQNTSTAKDVRVVENGGFLRMRGFGAFDLDDPASVEALMLLLYSLTDYLTERDGAQTLQLQRPAPNTQPGSQ